MRVLFVQTGPLRRFESMMSGLSVRGHRIHVALRTAQAGRLGNNLVLDRVCERHRGITRGLAPVRNDRWVALAEAMGLGVDYLRYVSPEYADASRLRKRAASWAPAKVVRLAGWPLVRSGVGVRALSRGMGWLEQATPDSPQVVAFLRSHRPDLLLVSPLVTIPSQAYYVRAARSLGIRSALLVSSWDNLTNKGLIRELPDRVYVWNEDQRREAVQLHGVPEERVVTTGAYPWDHWFGWRPSTSPEQFRQRLGLPVDRPIVLYVCSSELVAPDEPPFVQRWLGALRRHPNERLRTASVLIRPHPGFREQWRNARLDVGGAVAVWPLEGYHSADDDSNARYFDSIFHSSAVVGLNTSAMIEAAIVGRPVFTVLDPEYRQSQEGMPHFHYLPRENGGPVTVGRDFHEHLAQLENALSGCPPPEGGGPFMHRFVRPYGLDRPACPILVEAIEEQLAAPPPRPVPARRAAAALALRPLAVVADSMARRRSAQERPDVRGPTLSRVTPIVTLRSALWAFRAAGAARRQLQRGGVGELRIPHAPAVSGASERGVWLGLHIRRATCLVRAAVRQRWYLDQGWPRTIVVGVTRPSNGFRAHAWLEGDSSPASENYHELLRYPPA
jgi:Transglutaminase-like superfamily